MFDRVVGREEVEDEADEHLNPSQGEEAVHQTDRHDLLLQPMKSAVSITDTIITT